MKKLSLLLIGFAAIALPLSLQAATGTANIKGTMDDSDITGTLKFEDTDKGLHVSGQLENVPTGEHGFHIHEFGDCAEEGKKAGSHYNPDHSPHGHLMKDGFTKAHAGDLGNFKAGQDGTGKIDLVLPKLSLTGGKYPVAGRAVILHEKVDDFGQPVGNAGSRIGCGPILITGQ